MADEDFVLPQVPEPRASDAEDVAWALSTAEAMWVRGDHLEGIKWVRRAAEAAAEADNDARALELAKVAAELSGIVARRSRGSMTQAEANEGPDSPTREDALRLASELPAGTLPTQPPPAEAAARSRPTEGVTGAETSAANARSIPTSPPSANATSPPGVKSNVIPLGASGVAGAGAASPKPPLVAAAPAAQRSAATTLTGRPPPVATSAPSARPVPVSPVSASASVTPPPVAASAVSARPPSVTTNAPSARPPPVAASVPSARPPPVAPKVAGASGVTPIAQAVTPAAPRAEAASAAAVHAPVTASSTSPPETARVDLARADAPLEPKKLNDATTAAFSRRQKPEITLPREERDMATARSHPPSAGTRRITDEWDASPTQNLTDDELTQLAVDGDRRTSVGAPPLPAAATKGILHDPQIRTSQAVRVVVWRDGGGVHIAPAVTVVSAITIDALLVALEPTADLTAWLSKRER